VSIDVEQARSVASLARLELSDDELGRMAGQLSAIIDYVDQLGQVPTDGVEPLAHPLPIHNVFRPDDPVGSLPLALALANAPAHREDSASGGAFFGVPAVLG